MHPRPIELALALACSVVLGVILAAHSPAAIGASPANTMPDRLHDRLASGASGPELVVVPAGSFQMGSPDDEADRHDNESPVRTVTVKSFALGRTELTRGEFAAFVNATNYVTDAERNTMPEGKTGIVGCFSIPAGDKFAPAWIAGRSWRDPGHAQDDSHPVACVSWNDAKAYLAWLSRETGKTYRLPTEAEQEYTIRAGSQTAFAWGTDPSTACGTSNISDSDMRSAFKKRFGVMTTMMLASTDCSDGFADTSPVASLKANAFGLYDTVGNVLEWSQDCFMGYARAPTDGSAFEKRTCTLRTLRGAAFSDDKRYQRSASRLSMPVMYRYHNAGIRVARDLD